MVYDTPPLFWPCFIAYFYFFIFATRHSTIIWSILFIFRCFQSDQFILCTSAFLSFRSGFTCAMLTQNDLCRIGLQECWLKMICFGLVCILRDDCSATTIGWFSHCSLIEDFFKPSNRSRCCFLVHFIMLGSTFDNELYCKKSLDDHGHDSSIQPNYESIKQRRIFSESGCIRMPPKGRFFVYFVHLLVGGFFVESIHWWLSFRMAIFYYSLTYRHWQNGWYGGRSCGLFQ